MYQVYNPILWNAIPRIDDSLPAPIVPQARLSDFDGEENLIRLRMAFGIIQWIRFAYHQVWFGLIVGIQGNW
jgi:hypothetical protein